MTTHLLKIISGIIIISFIFLGFEGMHLKTNSSLSFFSVFLLILGIISILFLTFRISSFLKKLNNYFRNILTGNYDTGIETGKFLNDEVGRISKLANKASIELNTFDKLRAERTGMSHRTMDTIYRNINEALIIAEMGKNIFKFNPKAQEFFSIKQENFNFEAILKHKENTDFYTIFKASTETEKISKTAEVSIYLPLRDIKKNVRIKIMPLKDSSEAVKTTLIFLTGNKI